MKQRFLRLCCPTLVVLFLVAFFAVGTFASTTDLAEIKICIDPGHGGSDPGAVNGALWESEINLDVSYRLKALLESNGAEVVMTRGDDSYLDNRDRYTFCNDEKATILVSVHTNSVTDPLMDGSMALYFHSDDKVLAQAIYDEMYPTLRDTAPVPEAEFTGFGLSRFASGVLLKSDMPAAMMEPLFMSNPDEAALLVDPIYDPVTGLVSIGCADYGCRRGQIAQTLYQGVLSYFDGAEPPPTPDPGGTAHVSSIDMWSQQRGAKFSVYTRVAIGDSQDDPVAGAMVTVLTTQPDGSSIYASGLTGDDGSVIFKLRSGLTGEYVSTVTDVGKEGWVYDPMDNVETTKTLELP